MTNVVIGVIAAIVVLVIGYFVAGVKTKNNRMRILPIMVISAMTFMASCENPNVDWEYEMPIIDSPVDFPGIYQMRDSMDCFFEFGRPEIRQQIGERIVWTYIDYYEVQFIGSDIVKFTNIGFNEPKVQFDSLIIFEQHQKRFAEFMRKYEIEYSDSGCAFGWDVTADKYRGGYTLDFAMELMPKGVPQWLYNKCFSIYE